MSVMSVMTETDKVNIRAQVERLQGYKRRTFADIRARLYRHILDREEWQRRCAEGEREAIEDREEAERYGF